MKNIISKLTLAAVVAGTGLAVSSCADELDLHPNDYYVPETFWQDKSQYEGFITALQNQFRGNYTNTILLDAGEYRAGGLYLGTLADGSGSANENVIQNQYSETNCQFSTFAGYYGFIANLNELIYRLDNQDGILDQNTADGLRAIAYGWRAFCYFQMYRMYGGVPLRLEPDVILGNYDPTQLYMARSTAEETLKQIKSDIDESLRFFGSSTYTPSVNGGVYCWTKGATELLAGQVYLWSGKVSTADHTATPADVATAKQYFSNVLNNYGYQLMPNFFDIWQTPKSKESIFSVCYSSMEDGLFFGSQTNFNWAIVTGAAGGNYWSTMATDGYGKLEPGLAYRFGRVGKKTVGDDGKVSYSQVNSPNWSNFSLGVHRYMYKNAFFFQFNENDQRGDAFIPVYSVTDREQAMGVTVLEDFDPTQYDLMGTFVLKFRYKKLDGYQYWQPCVDMPIYRLPDAILGMAECCNYEGDNNGVATYINMLRERAYGDDWDVTKYGYTPGDFKANEVAILHESDKEFFLEGRRWFDLRRLTTTKGGSQLDHLVFQPEGCIGWGLPGASYMKENDGTPCATSTPVMTSQWEYRLLWPIDAGLIGSDQLIEQNPGY